MKRCGTHGIPQSGLPPVGGILAMPRTFRRNVWEREPPSDQRDGGGGRIPSWTQSLPPAHTNRKIDPRLRRSFDAAQEVSRTQEGAFFFRKKAYCGNQIICVAGGRKSVQTWPTPFSPLKKPLKIMGIPLAAPSRSSPSRQAPRNAPILLCAASLCAGLIPKRGGGKDFFASMLGERTCFSAEYLIE